MLRQIDYSMPVGSDKWLFIFSLEAIFMLKANWNLRFRFISYFTIIYND